MRGQRYHGRRKAILSLVCLAVAVRWWARRRPFRVAVEGMSMSRTLVPGDFLVALVPAALRRGCLVVVEHPELPGYEMVKRLAAVPGDEAAGRTLDADEYWVLGDHPDGSTDSRQFGPIGREAIRGVVRLRYWPPSRMSAFVGAPS